jgi:hypothetical protein
MNSRYAIKLSPIIKNKTVTTYSPTVFSLITIIIFAIFAIHPTIKTIISLQKTINDQNKTLNNLRAKSQDLATGINNYNSIPTDTKIKLFTLLPNSTNITCLLSDLTNMSTSSQATIKGLQIQPTELNRPAKCILDSRDLEDYRQNVSSSLNLKEIGFSYNGQANFSQLSGFLYLFDNSTRLVNIESASFNKPGEDSLSLVLNGKAFFYK